MLDNILLIHNSKFEESAVESDYNMKPMNQENITTEKVSPEN
jgi:hypothetical protein